MKNVHDQLQVQDEEQKHSILQFILLRNLLRLQNLGKAVIKMKNDAALKIQRTRRRLRSQKSMNAELEQKIDQLNYQNSLKIIQGWIRGKLKLIRAKRSKVNPAVE